MLDAFEIRLADLLADALVGAPDLGPIGRSGAVIAPGAGEVGIAVGITAFTPNARVGDDSRQRIGPRGAIRLRPILHLEGDAGLVLTAAPPPGPNAVLARQRLVAMLDRVLLALHPEAIRTGRAFLTNVDQGFELDGFRLASVGPEPEAADEPLHLRLTYRFAGRFWPVEEPAEGERITALPTRLTVMPVRLPEQVLARAGGPDVEVPIRLDIRVTGDAPSTLAARLGGAAPPGTLLGDAAVEVPPGFVGFPIGTDGTARLIYRPPAAITGRAAVRVETRLAHPDRPTIGLADFTIEVLPA